MEQDKKVLVSGASFAGLVMAYWMNKMGYKVTIVEIGDHLKMGGTPVDIKDSTVDIVKRMGLFKQINANRVGPEKWEFKNADDVTEHTVLLEKLPDNEFEIERDVLLNMLFELVKNDVNFVFGNSIASLHETGDYVDVTFKDGTQSQFELVFGCDGIHSTVRKIWFGTEAEYAHFFRTVFFPLLSQINYWLKKVLIRCMQSQTKVLHFMPTIIKPTSFLPSGQKKKFLMISVTRSNTKK